MTAIVCVDKNWAIGRENRLLFRISADLKHFRALTTGKTVVMGKNTLLSLPGGRPLPNRRNLVVSTTMGLISGAGNSIFDQPLLYISRFSTEIHTNLKKFS